MHQFIVVSISTKWPSPQFSMCECFFGCLVQQTSRDVNLTSIGLVEMRTDPSWQEWSLLECWSCITSYFFPGSCCYPGHMQGRYQMQVLSKAQWSIWHIMLISLLILPSVRQYHGTSEWARHKARLVRLARHGKPSWMLQELRVEPRSLRKRSDGGLQPQV